MPAEINIEKQIRDAIERGEFDDLKGSGEPLDLDAYFNTPEDLRMAFALLKSNEFVPEEVELMREIAELKNRLAASTDPDEQRSLGRSIGEKQLALAIAIEKHRRRR